MEVAEEDESEELLVRYNLNGVELNEDGFQKLSQEISLTPVIGVFSMPWGRDRVTMFLGELPLGNTLEPIAIRKGFVRQLQPDGKIGGPGARAYYEVCTHSKLLDVARKKMAELTAKG